MALLLGCFLFHAAFCFEGGGYFCVLVFVSFPFFPSVGESSHCVVHARGAGAASQPPFFSFFLFPLTSRLGAWFYAHHHPHSHHLLTLVYKLPPK